MSAPAARKSRLAAYCQLRGAPQRLSSPTVALPVTLALMLSWTKTVSGAHERWFREADGGGKTARLRTREQARRDNCVQRRAPLHTGGIRGESRVRGGAVLHTRRS